MDRGFIKLWRCIRDNPIWRDEPFTHGQAWVDLLLLANHKDGQIRVRGNIIPVKRGQVGWSVLSLAERWQWSRGKVERFFSQLEAVQQIVQHKKRITSLITITNYDSYQHNDTTERATDDTTDRATDGQQTGTNKNGKNGKNKSEDYFDKDLEIFEKCWNEYPNRDGKKAAIKHYKASVKSIEEARELFVAIQRYKEQVEGKDPQYIKNGSTFFNNWRDYAERHTDV